MGRCRNFSPCGVYKGERHSVSSRTSRTIDAMIGWLTRRGPIIFLVVSCAAALLGSSLATYQAQGRRSETVRIATALLPPRMNANGTGQEADIIRAALAKVGDHSRIEFFALPFTRQWSAFQRDSRFDAVAMVPTKAAITEFDVETPATPQVILNGFPSKPYIWYHNGIVFRSRDFPNGLGNKPIQALYGKRVVAFAGASAILSDLEYNRRLFSLYVERSDQFEHSQMLQSGAVDAVVADRLIIDQYNIEIGGVRYSEISENLEFDAVYCPTPYLIVFRRQELQQNFDKGLAMLKSSGELASINARYMRRAGLRSVARPEEKCN